MYIKKSVEFMLHFNYLIIYLRRMNANVLHILEKGNFIHKYSKYMQIE